MDGWMDGWMYTRIIIIGAVTIVTGVVVLVVSVVAMVLLVVAHRGVRVAWPFAAWGSMLARICLHRETIDKWIVR